MLVVNGTLTAAWLGIAVLALDSPPFITSKPAFALHPYFAVAFSVCVATNIIFMWFQLKNQTASLLVRRALEFATLICIYGLFHY
jgi:hypothetical protein